jgi:membrane protein
LILLIGSQLAFYYQQPAFLRIGRREPRLSNAMRERLALNVMYLVGQAFRDPDRSTNLDEICRKLKMPSISLAPVVIALESAGLLTTTEKEEFLPGQEMSRMRLNDILAVVRVHGETGSYRDPAWTAAVDALGAEMDGALAGVAADRTLSDLLDGTTKLGAGDSHLVDEE